MSEGIRRQDQKIVLQCIKQNEKNKWLILTFSFKEANKSRYMLIFWLMMTESAITSKAPSKYAVCSISCNLKEPEPPVLLNEKLIHIHTLVWGGSVAEWLGRRTWNPEVAGSSPALTTKLELFLGGPQFNSSVMFVNSQLVCLPPVGIFKACYVSSEIFVSLNLSGMPVN